MNTLAQLVAAYNTAAATCGKPAVKRFSDRKTAERRTAEMIAAAAEIVLAQAAAKKASKSVAPKDAAARAQAIAASWADPEVFAARGTRNAVTFTDASGTRSFRSVRQAFEQLGLPMGVHIRFRGKLKAAGQLEGFGGTWVVVAAE